MSGDFRNGGHHSRQDSDSRPQDGRRIIVVVDEPAQLEAMDAIMTRWGFTVLPCATFENARTTLTDGGVDSLIVDVRLGMFNGLQLVHLARQMHPTMRLIVMSGFDDPVLRAEAESAGATFLL
jgi:DNA-binding NtrC family response regulator